jgi:hypothetical protein
MQQIVITRALETVQILALLAGDFLSRKFIDDLWPPLRKALKNEIQRKAVVGKKEREREKRERETQTLRFSHMQLMNYSKVINSDSDGRC